MAYRDEVLADSPVGYWRLGESSGTTAFDETANNNDGTYESEINGSPTLGVTSLLTSDTDTAVGFNGDDAGYITLGTPNSTSTLSGWTWEVWLNTEESALVAPGIFGETATTDASRMLQLHSGSGTWSLRVDNIPGNWTALSGLPYDTTMHIVVTYEDAQTTTPIARVYRDGTEIATKSDFGQAVTAPYRAQALGARDVSNSKFIGTIDEAAFYTSALSATRVQAHYDAGVSTGPATPTNFTFTAHDSLRGLEGDWTAVAEADSYDFEIDEDIDGAWTAFYSFNTLSTSFLLDDTAGVDWATTYRCRVRSVVD